jgi:hypothetical protein
VRVIDRAVRSPLRAQAKILEGLIKRAKRPHREVSLKDQLEVEPICGPGWDLELLVIDLVEEDLLHGVLTICDRAEQGGFTPTLGSCDELGDPVVRFVEDLLEQLALIDLSLADPSERHAVGAELRVRLWPHKALKVTDHLTALRINRDERELDNLRGVFERWVVSRPFCLNDEVVAH